MSGNMPTLPPVNGYEDEAQYTVTGPVRSSGDGREATTAVGWIRERETHLQSSYSAALTPYPRAAAPARPATAPTPPSARDSLAETMAETYSLQSLPDGWNGYDAVAPPPATVRRALRWIEECYQACGHAGQPWHRPNVTASADGEVVYEWWADDRTLTVYVDADGVEYLKFGRGERTDLREHGSAADRNVCVKLMRWFSE